MHRSLAVSYILKVVQKREKNEVSIDNIYFCCKLYCELFQALANVELSEASAWYVR